MRIAVASDDGINVAAHTGRCKGFVTYDISNRTATRIEFLANSHTAHARGECDGQHGHDRAGAHHAHAPLLDALRGCRALVTRGLGPRLVADLATRGITAHICIDCSADDAARLFAEDRLIVAGHDHGCCCHHE